MTYAESVMAHRLIEAQHPFEAVRNTDKRRMNPNYIVININPHELMVKLKHQDKSWTEGL